MAKQDKALIAEIKKLQQIKPRKEWVFLTKKQIIGGRDYPGLSLESAIEGLRIVFNHKLAFASLATFIVLVGVFGFAQNSLPGEWLYPFKKVAEQSQKPFASAGPEFDIKIANNRLDDLSKVVNSGRKLAPAINEYQESVSQVARSITANQIKSNPAAVKEVVKEVKNIEKRADEIKSLGIQIDENIELDSALVQLIKDQVKDLEGRTLDQEQSEILEEIKADLQAGRYSDALEEVLTITSEEND